MLQTVYSYDILLYVEASWITETHNYYNACHCFIWIGQFTSNITITLTVLPSLISMHYRVAKLCISCIYKHYIIEIYIQEVKIQSLVTQYSSQWQYYYVLDHHGTQVQYFIACQCKFVRLYFRYRCCVISYICNNTEQ